jgi:cytochrome c5
MSMRILTAAMLALGLVMIGRADPSERLSPRTAVAAVSSAATPHEALTPAELTAVVQRYCQVCHNDQLLTGNMSLQGFDVADPMTRAETAEKMIQKLRAGMMPPPGAPRPGADTLAELVQTLERTLDRAAAAAPNPGARSFQRLNRAEYETSIRELLDIEIRSGDYLPLDTKSNNFDNIADAQLLSPTLLDAYFRAATEISRLAVGDAGASTSETQYRVVRWSSQVDQAPGTPIGTRGGTAIMHNFPADGEYSFRISFEHETTGEMFGSGRSALHTIDGPEQIEFAVDGERVAILDIDRWMNVEDPMGLDMATEPVFIHAGPHRVSAAFVKRYEGPLQDLVSPHAWSIASTAISGVYGIQAIPHLKDVVIIGPHRTTGVSETPSRKKIFSCRPTVATDAPACARDILSRIATQAFRRPAKNEEMQALMGFYEEGAQDGGFEIGVRNGIEAILSSPHFVFRLEQSARGAEPGKSYAIGDIDLASRLSYFLWATPPDKELSDLALQGKLSDRRVLNAQVDRMLADPRSEALATRFASQWLRLQDLDKINPDVRFYPDFHQQLKDAMLRETQLLFYSLVKDDSSVLDLFKANYTFVNERLAKHYGIVGITGEDFQRVSYPDDRRRGIFGHGSVLTLTSIAGRTSPVLRGKWVMEVILGTPPPPPPPGVPALEETAEAKEGRALTTRERMEMHRASPVCRSCHRFMDPIGLALDNFDVTGRWRIRENGAPLDTRGELYDGTPVENPEQLQVALLNRPVPILRNFTKNLMTYALGRRVEYYDMPAVRQIVEQATANDYRMSSFIKGVVNSEAFRMQQDAVTESASAQR